MMRDATAKEYAARAYMQDILSAAAYFLAAGTMRAPRAIGYFVYYLLSTTAGLLIISHVNPELLRVRGRAGQNTQQWDRILVPAYLLLMIVGIYVIAGLDFRYMWSTVSAVWLYPAYALSMLASAFMIWSMAVNRHFESTARIQEDRAHSVRDKGPYRIVRHPGYTSIIFTHIAIPLLLGSAYAYIGSAFIILLLVVRTRLEDSMLLTQLPGYKEYAQRVRYRLIPFVW